MQRMNLEQVFSFVRYSYPAGSFSFLDTSGRHCTWDVVYGRIMADTWRPFCLTCDGRCFTFGGDDCPTCHGTGRFSYRHTHPAAQVSYWSATEKRKTMARAIIDVKNHPANLDHSARIVAATGRNSGIYRTNSGFVACIGYPFCLSGTFETQQEAKTAAEDGERLLAVMLAESPN